MKMKSLFHSPERISVLGFFLLITAGTTLLMLPWASTGDGLGFIDALFTSTSASCVTGLTVVDTGGDLSLFGQGVVLFLIQTGGLGIMTISTLFLLSMGRRPGLTSRIIIEDTFTNSGKTPLSSLLKEIIGFALGIEAVGVVLMFFCFLPFYDISESLYFAFFHSISAFCNAGFALFPDSLEGFRGNWPVNIIICILVILGGIGFLVISELRRAFPYNRRTWQRLSLHTRLVLAATALLIMVGTLSILLMEWRNTLAPLSAPERVLASFFQAVSARTAGFNTLPIQAMANETLFVIILLMFIGACPGSCGGGIKTTTFVTLFLTGLSRLSGRVRPHLFNRTIPAASVGKAASVFMISALVIIIGLLAVLATDLGDTSHMQSRGKFLELFFETTSAFATAGLSTGITTSHTVSGKLILAAMMFVGRLGPLVLAMAISRRSKPNYYYAEEKIMVG